MHVVNWSAYARYGAVDLEVGQASMKIPIEFARGIGEMLISMSGGDPGKPEHISAQRRRLEAMSKDAEGHSWELSDHDREACRSGADAIDIVNQFMGTPDWSEQPTPNEKAIYARMRELLCRGEP